jgi:hypothetical protein
MRDLLKRCLMICFKRGELPHDCRWLLAGVAFPVLLLNARTAEACGPCTTPELWGVESLAGTQVVVTNFGLLHQQDAGWQLSCEETIGGGLILDVQGDAMSGFVSSDSGLFQQQDGLCDWIPGPHSMSNDWLLSYSLARVTGGGTDAQCALVLDNATGEVRMEMAEATGDFQGVRVLDQDVSYRGVACGGQPPSIFAAGYTIDERKWKLTFSLDGGDSWAEALPQVDNDYSTFSLLEVDPLSPHEVFVKAETVAGTGDEIWLFNAEEAGIRRLVKLEEGEIFGGIAFDGEHVWVAGQRRGAGSLYRASLEDLEFSRVVEAGPQFGCLSAQGGSLYACVNDFTRSSAFVLGASDDGGVSWEPVLTIEDLGKLSACGDECLPTLSWLEGEFGLVEADTESPSAEAGEPASEDTDGAQSKGGGCTLSGRAPSFPPVALWLAVALGAVARCRRRSEDAARP